MIRVLLVDDEPNLLEMSKDYMESMGGLDIIVVDSAPTALGILEIEQFDIIVSDYQMPDKDGIEFLKELRSNGDDTPFILFTGRGREEVAIKALNLGADFYIQKGGTAPVQFGELKNAIVQVVDRAHATRELKKRNRELRMLYEANKVMSSTLDLQTIYSAIHHFIKEMMECDALIVTRYSEEDNLIHCLYAWHKGEPIDVEKLPPIPLAPPGEGIQSEAIRTGESVLLRDFVDKARKSSNVRYFVDDDGNVHDDIPEEEPTQSALIVPLKHESVVIGVIQVFSERTDSYKEDDLRLLESLSVHAASAITNGILYQQASLEAEGRRQAEEISKALLQAFEECGEALILFDRAGRILVIGSTVLEILGFDESKEIHTLEELMNALDIETSEGTIEDILDRYMNCECSLPWMEIVKLDRGHILLRIDEKPV
ncbi:MAG TPA: response regulator [Methanomassiliicoccales archaeon]|nr:response regulator [Methanomassiliicoccales archaeon]